MPVKFPKRMEVWIVVILSFLGLGILIHKIWMPQIISALNFNKQEINVTFRESVLKVTPTHGDILEIAVLESDETLTRSDTKSLFDHLVYLGTTVSEIRVRVTYRYHIKLTDPWDISRQGRTLRIVAPQIYPSLPPAIHTDKMEKKSQAGWLRFNANQNLELLERSLTPTLTALSLTPTKIELIREPARGSIMEFVQRWVLTQPEWKEYDFDSVELSFPEEQDRP